MIMSDLSELIWMLMPSDVPIFVLSPILWEVDSRLCTQSAEYGHRSGLLFFMPLISKSKLLLGNESSPLSADSKKLLIGPKAAGQSILSRYIMSSYRHCIWELIVCESPQTADKLAWSCLAFKIIQMEVF